MAESKKKKSKKRIFKNIFIVFLIMVLLVTAAGIGATIKIISSAPEIDMNILDNLKQSSKFYDKDGNYIVNRHGGENRSIVSIKQIPVHLQNAYIAIEDERFYKHHGIDFKRIFGAIFANIKSGSKSQGGSTITQQLIKNYALTQKKSYVRKIQEMYLATQLERKLSKQQILEAYLNTIYLGPNVYGVQEASQYYFGKDVEDVTIAEAAFIAAVTQNPGIYNPYSEKNKKNPDNYLNRQRTVLKNMLKLGSISEDEYKQALNEDIVTELNKPKTRVSSNYMKYQWFVEAAIKQISDDLAEKLGIDETEARQRLISGGYNIYLTIDTKLQEKAQEIINNDNYFKGITPVYKNNIDTSKLQIKNPQSAAVVMDVNGEVRAIIGGRGDLGAGAFNFAYDGVRPPGSSIKPLSVYAPTIENKIVTPATVINDSKDDEEANEIFNKAKWFPSNYDHRYSGPITIRYALQESKNTIAAKLLYRLGIKTSFDYVKNKFGLSTVLPSGANNDYGYAPLALGQLTEGARPIEMAAAYTAFVNNGIRTEPILYTKVEDRSGNIILEKKPAQVKAISPQTAYVMNELMQNVVKNGTARAANLGAMPAGGKTGTTSDNVDGWFVGFTPYYTCAVWIGPSGENGADIKTFRGLSSAKATPIWKAIMLEAHRGLKIKGFDKPSGITTATICKDSGKLATDSCINKVTEIFIEGTEPTEYCDIHTAPVVPVPDNPTEQNNDGTQNNQTDTQNQNQTNTDNTNTNNNETTNGTENNNNNNNTETNTTDNSTSNNSNQNNNQNNTKPKN